ncbi:MAG: hypothetical protein IJL89_00095, partial [Firmicutes bacterium]|nr:hypothetical protein [Bacillota bacterium]
MSIGIIQAIRSFGYSQTSRELDRWGEKAETFFIDSVTEDGALDTGAFLARMQQLDIYSDKYFILMDNALHVYW